MRQPFSGTAERILIKLLPNDTGENGVWNVVPPPGESLAAAWRMANVDDLRNLRYDSAAGYGNPQSELFTLWLWRNHHKAPRTAVAL